MGKNDEKKMKKADVQNSKTGIPLPQQLLKMLIYLESSHQFIAIIFK